MYSGRVPFKKKQSIVKNTTGKRWFVGINRKGQMVRGYKTNVTNKKRQKDVLFMPMSIDEKRKLGDTLRPVLVMPTSPATPPPPRGPFDFTNTHRRKKKHRRGKQNKGLFSSARDCEEFNLFQIECRDSSSHKRRHKKHNSQLRRQKLKKPRRERGETVRQRRKGERAHRQEQAPASSHQHGQKTNLLGGGRRR